MTSKPAAWRLVALLCLACVLAGCSGVQVTVGTETEAGAVPTPATPATPTGAVAADTDPTVEFAPDAPTAERGDRTTVTVTEIVDGDTMDVALPDGTTETIRLLGVDTPEVHVETQPGEFEGIPDTESGRAWLDEWGTRASEFARARLLDERIAIATSERADRRGSYGRLLVTVRIDGESFNRALLEDGYARVYDGPFAQAAGFGRVEARARESGTGLWGFTADGSGSSASLSVAFVR